MFDDQITVITVMSLSPQAFEEASIKLEHALAELREHELHQHDQSVHAEASQAQNDQIAALEDKLKKKQAALVSLQQERDALFTKSKQVGMVIVARFM